MKSRFIPAAAAIAATATIAVSSAPLASASGVATPHLVGGGTATQPYSFEASLMLDFLDGRGPRPGCGATLIAKVFSTSWFETNAHCVTQPGSSTALLPGKFSVGIGSNNRADQISYPVSRVVVNPDWSWTTPGPSGRQGDIALLAVATRVPETPAVIATAHTGEDLTLIGWGRTTDDGSGPQETQLHDLDATVVPNPGCASAAPDMPGIAKAELCAGSAPGTAICFGDSGSAALDANDHLVGSASRTVSDAPTPCGDGNNDAIYTRVADYVCWMAKVILGIRPGRGMSPAQQADQAAHALAASQ